MTGRDICMDSSRRNDQLNTMLFVAALFHGVLILGVSFTDGTPFSSAQPVTSMEVILLARDDSEDLDMADLYDHNNRFMLLDMLKDSGVEVHRGAIPKKFEGGLVIADQDEKEMKIEVDSLVFAGRRMPVNSLSKELEDMSNVISIGDCKEAGRIMEAVWGAFNAVREME